MTHQFTKSAAGAHPSAHHPQSQNRYKPPGRFRCLPPQAEPVDLYSSNCNLPPQASGLLRGEGPELDALGLGEGEPVDLYSSNCNLSPLASDLLRGKGPELDALGLGEAKPVDLVFFIRLEVTLPEEGGAILALEGQDVRRHPALTRARHASRTIVAAACVCACVYVCASPPCAHTCMPPYHDTTMRSRALTCPHVRMT